MLRYALIVLSALAIAAPASAQENYGACSGIVAEAQRDGATIEKVTGVVVSREDRKVTYLFGEQGHRFISIFVPTSDQLDALAKEQRAVHIGLIWLHMKLRPNSAWETFLTVGSEKDCGSYKLGGGTGI